MPSELEPRAAKSAREIAHEILSPIVGDFIAKTSISMASKRIGKTADTITRDDLPAVSEALQPALRTLLGTPTADALVATVRARGHERPHGLEADNS